MADSDFTAAVKALARDAWLAQFGEDIGYTPTGGSVSTITAIVHRDGVTEEGDEEGAVLIRRMQIDVSSAEVSAPHPDDTYTIDSLTWAAGEVTDLDGGMATLTLIRTERKEATAEDFRAGAP